MDETEHRALREWAALHAVDALTDDERVEFDRHAQTCRECAQEVRSFDAVRYALSLAVPQIDPPPALRERIVGGRHAARGAPAASADLRSAARRASAGWLSAAALVVAAIGLAGYTAVLREQIGGLRRTLDEVTARLERSERQLETATRTASGAEFRMAVLTAPDLARIDLAGQSPAPRATGRAFWSRTRGLVFGASALPPLPPGRIYQIWVVTAGAALSAGLVQPDNNGGVTAFFLTPPDIPAPIAVAVTIEPRAGVPAPTGDKYLVGAVR